MKKIIILLISACISFTAIAGNAERVSVFETTNSFLNGLDSRNMTAVSMEMGYIAGFMDAMHLASDRPVVYHQEIAKDVSYSDIARSLKELRSMSYMQIGEMPLPFAMYGTFKNMGIVTDKNK